MAQVNVSQDDYDDLIINDGGICRHCGEYTYGIEPDARGYTCDACGRDEVYGIEELLRMGELHIEEDEDFLDDDDEEEDYD